MKMHQSVEALSWALFLCLSLGEIDRTRRINIAFLIRRCESLGVSSRMVVSVDLKIAPLNLDPWPSTGSIPSADSTHTSAAAHTDLGQRQVDPVEVQVADCTQAPK